MDGYAWNGDNDERRRRAYRRGLRQALARRLMATLCVALAALATAAWACADTGRHAAQASEECAELMVLPVRAGRIASVFERPEYQWSSGHRGIDVALDASRELIAPADGVVSFAGKVASKSVVSLRHGSLTLTFEPAQTTLQHGTQVARGEAFAIAQGVSDHCADTCVHWGIKDDAGYVDPSTLLGAQRIVLLPLEG